MHIQDKYLWQDFVGGSKSALSKIFVMHYDDLFRYGNRLIRNREIVRDGIQEVFLKLWKNKINLDEVRLIKPYLMKSLRNYLLNYIESQKPTFSFEPDFEKFIIDFSTSDFTETGQDEKESYIKLTDALNHLTVRQREVIYLKYFQELDIDSISKITGISNQSVRNSIHRGMLALRELMLINLFYLLLTDTFISKTH